MVDHYEGQVQEDQDRDGKEGEDEQEGGSVKYRYKGRR
jgi:hypothetical protein